MTPTTPLLDAATRADASPIGGNWLGPIFSGANQLQVSSQLIISDGGASYWKSPFPGNQEAWVTLTQKWANLDLGLALFLNVVTPNTGTISGYAFAFYNSSGDGQDVLQIFRIDSGGFTTLGAVVLLGTLSAGNRFWVQNLAGTLNIYLYAVDQWALLATRSDATYSGGFIGLGLDDLTLTADNFGGGVVGHNVLPPTGGHKPYPFSPGNPNYPTRL